MKFFLIELALSLILLFCSAQGSGVINSNFTSRATSALLPKMVAPILSVPLPAFASQTVAAAVKASSRYSWSKNTLMPTVAHAHAVSAYYDSSAYSYLPNPADMTNEGNVQRVMAVLDGNIKQWSFIEAQLLEPNVNLGMVS